MTKQIIDQARSEGRVSLTEVEAKELLRETGVNIVETRLAGSRSEAVEISGELGFPVVLKIASLDVVHKSDMGGRR